MYKEKHIYSICMKLDIGFKAISDYNIKNRNKIENINTIFSLKDQNNKEIVLALLYLFASGEKDKVLKKFRRETGLQDSIYNRTSEQITQYNLMLLAALIFNPEFYVMAVHYYGAIKAGFPISIAKEDSASVTPQTSASETLESSFNYKTVIIIWRTYDFMVSYSPLTMLNKGINDTTEDFNAMISENTKRIEANPKDNDARIMRGLAYYKNGEYTKAIEDLQTVSEMNKGMEGVYYAMGKSYYEIGKKDKAIEAFEKVKTIDPEFADINEILEKI
jgi:tetratricopeptide (TPR) repeat protein